MKMIPVLLIFFTIIYSCNTQNKNEITELYEQIKEAEINKDLEELFEFSNQNTKDYFNNIKSITLFADSTYIRKTGIFDKIMILRFRATLDADELNLMTTKSLFRHYFLNVRNIKSAIKDRVLKNIKVSDSIATAEVNSKIFPYPDKFVVKFSKENNQWKYDFPSYFEINQKNLEKMNSSAEFNEDRYLKSVLRMQNTKRTYNELWTPLDNIE